MRRVAVSLGAVVLLSAAPALAVTVDEVPNPRATGVWVADLVDAIDAGTESRINRAIDSIEKEQGVEIAVVCVESVDAPTPKDFATSLFNRWGIGKAGKNNGLLVLLVRGQRRLEMETGYGTEAVLTDGWLKSMQGTEMVPFFKAGDYGSGIEAGVNASISRLRRFPDGIPPGTPPESHATPIQGARAAPSPHEGGAGWGWLLFGGVFVVGGGGLAAWTHRQNRTCPTCKVLMKMVPEEEDDVHLDEGQQTEERLGSIDYQFYTCGSCDFTHLIPVRAWFSGYSSCMACHYRAARCTSVTIEHATYSSTGLEELTTHCSHCNHSHVRTRTIPRKTQSSSSSSGSSFGGGGGGGGSSFGGGSSGGGGAGSSW